jgi:hypothetical protein
MEFIAAEMTARMDEHKFIRPNFIVRENLVKSIYMVVMID